ncbi:hypothetical protein OAO01_03450 [Oligoflexia bacterium]|nr:hypothetical protein [Oligoflexia bacterium]
MKKGCFVNLRALISTIALVALTLGCFSPYVSAQQSTDQYMNDVIAPYMLNRRAVYNNLKETVEGKIQGWADNPDLGQYHMGNLYPDAIFDLQNDWLQDLQTFLCNMSDIPYTHFHSYDDLHDGISFEVGSCSIDFKYEGSGLVAGRCLNIITIPPYCWVFFIWADLVDYLYPVQKINVSSQPFYSRYLKLMQVFPAMMKLLLELGVFARFQVFQTLREFTEYRNAPIPTSLPPSTAELVFSKDFPKLHWLQQTRSRGFARLFPEEEIYDDREWYMPNRDMKQPKWATDLDAFELAYWLQETKDLDKNLYKKHMQKYYACAENNMATGKTPDFPKRVNSAWKADGSAGSSGSNIGGIQCLDDVGEVMPYQAWHRPHISDGFFQTLFKSLKAYNTVKKHRNKIYTYDNQIDKWHFFPSFLSNVGSDLNELNDRYISDINDTFQCNVMKDITRPNLDWKLVNVPLVGSKEETTIERFSFFSGCWGWKGWTAWLLAFRWMPSVHGQMYNLRVK